MNPFAKVNLPFDRRYATTELCRGDQITKSTGTVYPFKMNRAYMVFKPAVFKALDADDIHWCEVQTHIAPHIDIVATVRLNVYTVVNGGVTSFYTEKQNSKPTMAAYRQAQMLRVPSIYNPGDLEYQCSFVAKKFDVYVLDTKVVHDVSHGEGHRSYIQLTWKTTPFSVILNRLKDLINV